MLVLPYRGAAATAKTLSTIDWLSGGRLIVGVGAGWLQAEFAALGVPFDERGRRTDQAIRALLGPGRQARREYAREHPADRPAVVTARRVVAGDAVGERGTDEVAAFNAAGVDELVISWHDSDVDVRAVLDRWERFAEALDAAA